MRTLPLILIFVLIVSGCVSDQVNNQTELKEPPLPPPIPAVTDLSSEDTITGQAVSTRYASFGEPETYTIQSSYNFSSLADDTRSISLTITDDFVYRYAFISYDGQPWQQAQLQGTLGTHYITDTATATIPLSASDFGLTSEGQSRTRNYIVVYSCDAAIPQYCHDGWQIWQFDAGIDDSPPAVDLTNECDYPQPEWIWCDDFEQDRLSSYFEYVDDNGDFIRVNNIGIDGSTGMRALFDAGEVSAGNLKLAFGRTPQSYFDPVDAGTADHRDVYWRMYVKNEPGWVGGGGDKLSRSTIFASASSWAQAMIGHVWSGGAGDEYLILDPASGTDTAGNLQTTGYNDFENLRWLGSQQSANTLFSSTDVGKWYCVEARVRLNDPGQSNGEFTLWIDDGPEAQRTGMNWIGSFQDYGINTIMFENYWNDGSPATQERYFDNIVVSTERIGCGTPASDTDPPVISNPLPSGAQPNGTTSVTLSVDTNENATCKYDTSDVAYSSMSYTFLTTGEKTHTQPITGLSDGDSRTYSVRCQDTAGNSNPSSTTISFSIANPGSGSDPAGPNEPSGFTMLTSREFDSFAVTQYDPEGYADGWDHEEYLSQSNLAIVSEPSAQISPSDVLRILYYAGRPGGTAPTTMTYDQFSTEGTAFYHHYSFKVSDNFEGHSTRTNKIFHIWAGTGSGGNNMFYSLEGIDLGTLTYTPRIQGVPDARDNLPANMGISAEIIRGQWYDVEVLLELNTNGQSNGVYKTWIDGQLTHDYNDVEFYSSGDNTFKALQLSPTWGGGGDTVDEDMYMYIDHAYASTGPRGAPTSTFNFRQNEPVGFSPVVGREFDTKASTDSDRGTGSFPWKTGGSEGWDGVEYRMDAWQLDSDPTDPVAHEGGSTGSVMTVTYDGVPSNTGPGVIQTQYFPGSAHGNLDLQKIYTYSTLKLGSNYQAGGVTNKIFFHRSAEPRDAGEPFLVLMDNGGDESFTIGVNFQGAADNPLGFFWADTAPGNNIQKDEWYQIETMLEINSAQGVADGIFRLYVDGTLVLERTDVEYLVGPDSSWDTIHVSPTCGSCSVLNQPFGFSLGTLYVSGQEAAPSVTMDFSDYSTTAELISDCTNWNCVEQDLTDDEGNLRIMLDDTVQPPGATKSMRYHFNHPGSGCNSITIMRTLPIGQTVQEVWAEFNVRWSDNFRTTNANCYPNDHKLIFGDTEADESGRWAFYVGADTPPHSIQVERPLSPTEGFIGAYYLDPGGEPSAEDVWDGEWHVIRLYFRHSTTVSSGDGAMKVWIDGTLHHDEEGFDTTKPGGGPDRITGFSFNHNKDDGPPNEDMYIWWGPINYWTEDPGW